MMIYTQMPSCMSEKHAISSRHVVVLYHSTDSENPQRKSRYYYGNYDSNLKHIDYPIH